MQQYDIGSIFGYVAKLAGAKNIDEFKIKVRPDGDIERDAEAGNLIPIGGPNGGGSGGTGANTRRGTGGGAEQLDRPSEPGQISGMGASG